ncbi:hypothetical protein QR46_2851 [Giardia duodenalis assemblage B]|uniref:Uncharacterized protein n=1 Tax=Giardia duodenalis assemblage B TaxID=1394984 RepID=A0A132NU23_GIAIN|nr:hypothetical protein QR46_2851 [Giardia intestinalis assemblage B]
MPAVEKEEEETERARAEVASELPKPRFYSNRACRGIFVSLILLDEEASHRAIYPRPPIKKRHFLPGASGSK